MVPLEPLEAHNDADMEAARSDEALPRKRRARKATNAPPMPTASAPSGSSATHVELMDAFLQPSGLRSLDVGAHGDCQFRALASQLWGNAERHHELRHAVVTELTEHPDVYKTYRDGDEGWTDDNAGWDRLIREMAQPGNWGCHVTLCAAANAYGRSVHVACVDATTKCVYTTDVPPTRTPATGDPVTVAYVGLNHYVAVVPLEDAASSESPAGNNAGHETSPALDPPTDKSPSRAPRTYKSRSGQNAGEKARTLACRL